MRVIAGDWETDIYLTDEEAEQLCHPGEGADTCIWLAMSGDGWNCMYHNRPIALIERWKAGLTVAKRDGCERVRDFETLLREAFP